VAEGQRFVASFEDVQARGQPRHLKDQPRRGQGRQHERKLLAILR
jgi:hypothetical protein